MRGGRCVHELVHGFRPLVALWSRLVAPISIEIELNNRNVLKCASFKPNEHLWRQNDVDIKLNAAAAAAAAAPPPAVTRRQHHHYTAPLNPFHIIGTPERPKMLASNLISMQHNKLKCFKCVACQHRTDKPTFNRVTACLQMQAFLMCTFRLCCGSWSEMS